jgi:hypothetical protein
LSAKGPGDKRLSYRRGIPAGPFKPSRRGVIPSNLLFFLFFFIIANRIYFSFEVKTIKGENKNKCWNLIRRRSKETAKKIEKEERTNK